MTTSPDPLVSPEPTPDDVPGNRYRCNCGWSHTVREDSEGCREDTDLILAHIRAAHPDILADKDTDGHVFGKVVTDAVRDEIDDYVQSIRYRAQRFRTFQDKADFERERLRSLVVDGVNAGMSELHASKLAGVTRQTVRSWMGK